MSRNPLGPLAIQRVAAQRNVISRIRTVSRYIRLVQRGPKTDIVRPMHRRITKVQHESIQCLEREFGQPPNLLGLRWQRESSFVKEGARG